MMSGPSDDEKRRRTDGALWRLTKKVLDKEPLDTASIHVWGDEMYRFSCAMEKGDTPSIAPLPLSKDKVFSQLQGIVGL